MTARRLHRFLIEQRFYPVTLAATAAVALLAGRWVGSGATTFRFMLWNLFLAGIPYGVSLLSAALDRSGWRGRGVALLLLSAPWLAFLPNAPYLVTDLLHLRTVTSVPVWYDAAMFASFAWAGVLAGVASLETMRKLLASRVGAMPSYAASLGVIGLSALGIYLGRVVRLNSWDLALRPERVLLKTWAAVHSREALLFVLLFSGFFLVCHVTLTAPSRLEDSEPQP
jgi:uncharacterized membrane protein